MIHTANEQIYKYRLINYIGGGNFGEVWTAEDISLKSHCAIKLLHQSETSIDERLLEAQIGNRLRHSNVVNIKYADVVEYGNPGKPVVIIAMPFYKNGSVLSKLNGGNFLDLDNTVCRHGREHDRRQQANYCVQPGADEYSYDQPGHRKACRNV